jgi:hypothetical protein
MDVDFEKIFGHYGIQWKRTKDGKGVIRCPFHKDKNPSCQVNFRKNVYYCFPCGDGGGIVKFIMKMEKLDRTFAKKFISNTFGVTYKKEKLKIDNIEKKIVSNLEIRNRIIDMMSEAVKNLRSGEFTNAQFLNVLLWLSNLNDKMIDMEEFDKRYRKTKRDRYDRMFLLLYESCFSKIEKLRKLSVKNCGIEKLKQLKKYAKIESQEKFFELMGDDGVKKYLYEKFILKGIVDMMERIFDWFRYSLRNFSNDEKYFIVIREELMSINDTLDKMIKNGNKWTELISELNWRNL